MPSGIAVLPTEKELVAELDREIRMIEERGNER